MLTLTPIMSVGLFQSLAKTKQSTADCFSTRQLRLYHTPGSNTSKTRKRDCRLKARLAAIRQMMNFMPKMSNCNYVREMLSRHNFYISDTEWEFPLAYAIAFHDSPQQIVRFLKVIYRPQNIYILSTSRRQRRQETDRRF